MSIARTGGSSAAERGERYACDEVAPDLTQPLFRARTVAAEPATVYRWLGQLRVAPYSWDLIDNLGRRSPGTITDHRPLQVGQRALVIMRVCSFVVDDHLTVLTRGRWSMAMTYRVRAVAGGTRLAVKVRCGYPSTPDGWAGRVLLPWGDAVMVHKQLATLAGLAEDDRAERVRAASS